MGEARYSQDEVAAILKRTAEIEGERRNGAQAVGLSLADLESIAEESGLDPDALRAAARELAAASSAEAPSPTSAPTGALRLHHHRSLEGELGDSELEQLVESAGLRLKLAGSTAREGHGWQWAERWGQRRLRVRAEARHGSTDIELVEDLGRLAWSVYGRIMLPLTSAGCGLSLILGFNAESSSGDALIVASIGTLASLALAFGISRVALRRSRQTRDLQLERLATELAHEGRGLLRRAAAQSAQAAGDSELDRAPLHREEQAGEDEASRRRRPTRDRSRA